MSAAQEEFNQLVANNRATSKSHPEDAHTSSDPDQSDSDKQPTTTRRRLQRRRGRDSDSDADDRPADDMVSSRNYHIPNTVFDANTGPKGVIADAQAFEKARKKSFRRTLLSVAGLDNNGPIIGSGNKSTRDETSGRRTPADGSSGSEDDEERFLRKWRAARMQELQNRSIRRSSPRGRVFGKLDTVDAAGYLDAIEKVTSDTVVVVMIFDPRVCLSLAVPFHIYLLSMQPR